MKEMEEEYGSRNPYNQKDLQRLREQYKPGQKIAVILREEAGKQNRYCRKKRKEYTVLEIHKHHLSCMDKNGCRESFGYIELEQIREKRGE